LNELEKCSILNNRWILLNGLFRLLKLKVKESHAPANNRRARKMTHSIENGKSGLKKTNG
jgi:hypothetical protein